MKKLFFTLINRLIRGKTKYNKEYWDQKAEIFSGKAISLWANEKLNAFYHRSHLELIEKYINDAKNKRVLDVGCGIGRLSLAFAEKGAFVDAFDWSSTTIEKAKKYHPHSHIHYHVKSVFDLNQGENLYDIIFVFGVLSIACKNEKDLKMTIHNLLSLLNTNGQLFIFEPIHRISFFARNLVLSRKRFVEIINEEGGRVDVKRNLHFLPSHLILSIFNVPKLFTKIIYYCGEILLKTVKYKVLGDYYFVIVNKKNKYRN